MTITSRVMFHLIGKPLLAGLVLPALGVLLAVSFIDTNIDWSTARGNLASLPFWQGAAVFSVLAAAWCWMAGHALRPVWQRTMIRYLVRQPVTRWRWVWFLLPHVSAALAPVAALCWLIPLRGNPLLHYIAFTGLAWLMVLGASYRGRDLAMAFPGGILVYYALLAGYLHAAWFLYLVLPLGVLLLPVSVAPIPRQITVSAAPGRSHLGDQRPARAVLRRDLCCLLRTNKEPLVNLGIWSLLMPAMMFALRVNGGFTGRDALVAALILFSIAASAVYDPLERLKFRLGREFHRLRWPITGCERTLVLAQLIGLLLAPAAVLIALFASTMGPGNVLVLILYCLASVALCAALFCRYLGSSSSTLGLYQCLLIGHAVLAVLLPGWVYGLIAVPGSFLGFRAAARRLRLWAVASELGR